MRTLFSLPTLRHAVAPTLLCGLLTLCGLSLTAPAGRAQAAAPTSPSAGDRPPAVPLWPAGAPGALGDTPADVPTLAVYHAPIDTSNGAAMVVCPGGGYSHLSDREGDPIARWLNTLGVTAVVLHYRLGPRYHHPAELQDAAHAIRLVRANAGEWRIDPARVGIIGFSAGGHLAATLSTHFDAGQPGAADPVERLSDRPDLAVLVYPVITLSGPYAHAGSRQSLLGDSPPADLVESLSAETQVTAQTPPTFLVHSAADTTVPVENSLLYATALHKAHVPLELHVYDHGPHGFALGGTDPVLSTWPARCADWLKGRGFLTKTPAAP